MIATGFTWAMTVLGALVVFTNAGVSRRLLNVSLGFASGVMIAASYWSLLAPAIEMARSMNVPVWLPAVAGFLFGAFFLRGIDWVLPHLHPGSPPERMEGINTRWRRSTLLVLAITLHNLPEGLAVGVAFGALSTGIPSVSVGGAIALTIGIGLQNIPEGTAVALPLRGEGMSRWKSLWYAQLSAIVEPVAAVAGAMATSIARPILPYALSFAAGAMIFAVIEEILPESQRTGNPHLATMSGIGGFALMMFLETLFTY